MLEFTSNTYLLEYKDGAYVCDGKKRVEAPLNLETLEAAVRQCPKLQAVSLEDVPFGDQCFPILAQIPKLNMLALLRGRQITGHGLKLLADLPLKDLFLQRTALDDEGLSQAAQIKKLERLYIAACPHVTFEGLSGQEFAGSLKEALGILKIENPAAGLREDLKKGRYNDEELEPVIQAVRLISSIWQDPERGSSPNGEEEMNILMLLAAAFEMISRLHAALKCVKPITPP